MLEPILKGLIEWIYGLMIDIMAYASGELIGVMSMDLSYFERTAPVIHNIVNVFTALGWALLIGNLIFQSLKAMMSGAGFEAEDPKILFMRTFAFSFLLLASKQICEICSKMTGTVIELLNLPSSINIVTPDESMFTLGAGAKWLLVIIVGIVLMVQMVKLLFEIGERYVITSVLTFFAPVAFAMGGSKNTNDIFKGWCRMYGSMQIMMIMNIVFLKLIMSAMTQMSSGGVLVWLVFVVALTRVARKIDSHIGQLGLNPAQTGNGIGSRLPGVMTAVAVRTMASLVGNSFGGGRGSHKEKSGSAQRHRPYRGGSQGYRRPGAGNTRYGGGTGTGGSYTSNTGGSVTNAGGKNTSNVNGQTGNIRQSSTSPHTSVNANSQQSAQSNIPNQGGVKGVNQGGVKNANPTQTTRPPIPRNTGGSNPNGDVIAGQVVRQNTHNTSNHNVGGNSVRNTGTVSGGQGKPSTHTSVGRSTPVSPEIKPPTGHDTVSKEKGVSGGSKYTGGNVSVQNHSQRSEQIRQTAGGSHISEQTGGDSASISLSENRHISGDVQNTSYKGVKGEQHTRYEQLKTNSSEHKTTEKINHEYSGGKFNPSAANKKAKTNYYQKGELKKQYYKKKDDGDGKRKK